MFSPLCRRSQKYSKKNWVNNTPEDIHLRMRSFFFIGLIVLFTLCGCAHTQKISRQDTLSKKNVLFHDAQEALDGVFKAYEEYDPQNFTKVISPDFSPDRLLFLGIVDSGFSSGTFLTIQYKIIQATSKNTMLDVVFAWKKRKIPYSSDNTPIVQKGKSEFIFEQSAGTWLLAEVKGDTPF